jgi:hypothetical protein
MKGNPAVPGGLLTSKPTWPNAEGCSPTSAFFCLRRRERAAITRDEQMIESNATMAKQFARGKRL